MGLRGRSKFDKTGNTYFLTTTVLEHMKVFSFGDKYYDVLIESLKYLINEHEASLIAFVLMPNHLHLLINMPEGESISDLMRDFKRHTSSKIKKVLEFDGRIGIVKKLTKLSGTGKYKLWKDRFDDLIVSSTKVLETKINYIHLNPVRAGLVKEMTDWKYSSARNYYLDDNSLIDIERFIL